MIKVEIPGRLNTSMRYYEIMTEDEIKKALQRRKARKTVSLQTLKSRGELIGSIESMGVDPVDIDPMLGEFSPKNSHQISRRPRP